jgi:3-oxoacyl-[acyl-carrier protein] reductase
VNFSLKNRTALVCGASQGIGEASARKLASMGARVVLLARSREKLEKLKSELPNSSSHEIMNVDIVDREKLKNEIQSFLKSKGAIEIVICNTGGPKAGSLLEATEADFLSGLQNHILVNSLLAQVLVPQMKEKNYGRIINIVSTSVKSPIPNLGVSNTIRAAVAGWAKTLSFEVGPFGITVNNVLPGYTETPRLTALASSTAQKMKVTEEEIRKTWKASIPLGRFADATEIAHAVGFLASPEASYITGVSLPVDGGRTNVL